MIIPKGKNHLALRFANVSGIACIDEHYRVINENGYVWFGKIGSKPRQNSLKKMLEENSNYLILKEPKATYFCTFIEYSEKTPQDRVYPEYYDSEILGKDREFSIWFKITKINKVEDYTVLQNVVVSSSRNKFLNACSQSMASHFFTYNKETIKL